MHAAAFADPVFRGQYFKELLPRLEREPDLLSEAARCMACHAPVVYVKGEGLLTSEEGIDPRMAGVTCDFCHTIRGYRGERPGNGNYVSVPGDQKLGPFKHASSWHHVYSELQTKSEFCAICHSYINRYGLETRSTYSEWKNSRYAGEGIQCQDCHMNVRGFLTAGKPVYESGKAAYMTLGRSPYRERLYTHRFPGAHSKTQLTGALRLAVEVRRSAGGEITVEVLVDNSKTGHKMPTGSAELRLLWLDLKAVVGGKVITVPIGPDAEAEGYGVSGRGRFDREVLGDDVPEGSRIYRAVFVDAEGKQTLSFYDAARIVFDNRLGAAEVRKEIYQLRPPRTAGERLSLKASLYYLPYPSSFADRLGLPRPEPVEIASAVREIPLR